MEDLGTWHERMQWLIKVLGSAVALTLLSLWGTALTGLLVDWGLPRLLQIFGGCLVAAVLIVSALMLPAVITAIVERQERAAVPRHAGSTILELLLRIYLWMWLPTPYSDLLYASRSADAQTDMHPASDLQRDDHMRVLAAELRRLLRWDIAYWGSVIVTLGLESAAQFRLRPDAFPGLAMTVAVATAMCFFLTSVGRDIYLRVKLTRLECRVKGQK